MILCSITAKKVLDATGYFGINKTYADYGDPNMHHDKLVVEAHVPYVLPVCTTNLQQWPQPQALPVPDHCEESVAVNFIGLLSEDHKYNMLVTHR